MNDSWLLYASWAFFAVLSVIVAALSVAAFGPDLMAFLARNFPQVSKKNQPDIHR